MAEGLATADGEQVDLDTAEQDFAAAMAAPAGGGPEQPEPPDIGMIDPEAPFGRKLDGTPKKTPGGRPPKRDKPRVTDKPPPRAITSGKPAGGGRGQQGEQKKPGADYAKGIGEFLAGMSLALAVVPVPEARRVHCRYQSAVLDRTGDGLAAGLAMCAEHNGAVRWAVDKLTQGGSAWVFPATMAILPFAVSTTMLWKSPVTDEMRAGADRIEQEAMDRLRAEMGLDPDEDQADEPEAAQAA